ncbi:MAG: deoxyribodipyrimidine photo-lyase [Brachybacterium sp.]|nr:deoxyribodipyrimidine photo-lyase [Brachybacterium sp.]
MRTLWWIRDDLRLEDNPALRAAAADGEVIALHVLEDVAGARALGGATRWWLHHSLTALAGDLRRHGVPLLLATGDPRTLVPKVAAAVRADAVTWNRRYYQPMRDVDADIKSRLHDNGLQAESFPAALLHEPWTVRTGAGGSYRVYSAFARACAARPAPRAPHPVPEDLHGPNSPGGTEVLGAALAAWTEESTVEEALAARGLLPTAPDWAGGLRERWTPGEAGAHERLDDLEDVLATYVEDRDRPDVAGTSYLSPHLRFGEISPFQAWACSLGGDGPEPRGEGPATFRKELLWREFAWQRRYYLDDLATRNIREEFDRFAWDEDEAALTAWQQGRTGFALVDAGMRELWETGYMHNRVRMVTASFLVKNLRQDWRLGEQWFWDTLVDADEASNPFNWQWVAGTGDDAAPYFRIFNPERQRERFDPEGRYVARWTRELAVEPIVDLRESRQAALDALAEISDSSGPSGSSGSSGGSS